MLTNKLFFIFNFWLFNSSTKFIKTCIYVILYIMYVCIYKYNFKLFICLTISKIYFNIIYNGFSLANKLHV